MRWTCHLRRNFSETPTRCATHAGPGHALLARPQGRCSLILPLFCGPSSERQPAEDTSRCCRQSEPAVPRFSGPLPDPAAPPAPPPPPQFKSWWRYIEARKDATAKKRYLLFERALRHLPGSYKLWNAYLNERLFVARGSPPKSPLYESLNNTFERALVTMHKMPRIWELYLRFLLEQKLVTRTRRACDRALAALPVTQHERVWAIYLVRARSESATPPSLPAVPLSLADAASVGRPFSSQPSSPLPQAFIRQPGIPVDTALRRAAPPLIPLIPCPLLLPLIP